jgi:hypothetical protein
VKIWIVTDHSPVSVCERFEVFRQVIRPWHSGAIDEQRHYRNSAPKCRADLNADEVIRIIDSACPIRLSLQPSRTDNGQEHGTLLNFAVEVFDKAAINASDLKGVVRMCMVWAAIQRVNRQFLSSLPERVAGRDYLTGCFGNVRWS